MPACAPARRWTRSRSSRRWRCSSCRARSAALPKARPILANVGRFGPYIKYGSKYVSLKDDDPYTVTLERALECIRAKQIADANRIIQDFGVDGIQVLNGRYGPVHQRQREECAHSEGPRSQDADAGGVPCTAGGGAGAPAARPRPLRGEEGGQQAGSEIRSLARCGAGRETRKPPPPRRRAAAEHRCNDPRRGTEDRQEKGERCQTGAAARRQSRGPFRRPAGREARRGQGVAEACHAPTPADPRQRRRPRARPKPHPARRPRALQAARRPRRIDGRRQAQDETMIAGRHTHEIPPQLPCRKLRRRAQARGVAGTAARAAAQGQGLPVSSTPTPAPAAMTSPGRRRTAAPRRATASSRWPPPPRPRPRRSGTTSTAVAALRTRHRRSARLSRLTVARGAHAARAGSRHLLGDPAGRVPRARARARRLPPHARRMCRRLSAAARACCRHASAAACC